MGWNGSVRCESDGWIQPELALSLGCAGAPVSRPSRNETGIGQFAGPLAWAQATGVTDGVDLDPPNDEAQTPRL
jgi:hypothetical protein